MRLFYSPDRSEVVFRPEQASMPKLDERTQNKNEKKTSDVKQKTKKKSATNDSKGTKSAASKSKMLSAVEASRHRSQMLSSRALTPYVSTEPFSFPSLPSTSDIHHGQVKSPDWPSFHDRYPTLCYE